MTVNRAAQKLGRMAKGVPKNYSPEERARRAELMRKMNDRRRKKLDESVLSGRNILLAESGQS